MNGKNFYLFCEPGVINCTGCRLPLNQPVLTNSKFRRNFCHKLLFSNPYIVVARFRRLYMFQTINSR